MAGSASNPNCLFMRGRDDDPDTMEDMWDDTALIRAYDKAISSVQRKLNIASNSNSNNATKKNNRVRKQGGIWKVGDPCQARFSEDGYFYEATIGAVDYSRGRCFVKYAHYGNEEEVNLSDVLSATASLGEPDLSEFENSTVSSVGRLSVSESGGFKGDKGCVKKKKKRHGTHTPAPAPSFPRSEFLPRASLPHRSPAPASAPGIRMPPLPPHLKTNSDDPALNSMLMSWYMCGYHSGYYQGVTDTKTTNH